MTQSTVLAAGVTAATSTDIVIAAGATVIVGIFSAVADAVPSGLAFGIDQDTPGADNTIGYLGSDKRQVVLTGPGTFRVKRPAYTGTAFGVFVEN
ncbi:hypothetical protein [Pseudomonas sp.]|uniref:hypothetical protein n=1 Tax=Pseudomonas sp. TaxID=306 RepID=UPI0032672918